MTKQEMKETAKRQYMAAVHEAKTAKEYYVGKRQYKNAIADMILLLKLATIEELQEWENMV